MKTRTWAGLLAALLTMSPTAVASAAPSPSPSASCMGTLVAFEAHLAPGFIGDELKELAPQSAGEVGAFARVLAQQRGGSLEACLPRE
jgi:hypothetical protein